MTRYSSLDLKRLLQRIDKLCKVPFARIEPLDECAAKPSSIVLPSLKVVPKIFNKKNADKYPKTKAEADVLLKEVEEFTRMPVPFKLTGLDDIDQVISKPKSKDKPESGQDSRRLNKKLLRLQQEAKVKNKVKCSNLFLKNPDSVKTLIRTKVTSKETTNQAASKSRPSPRKRILSNNFQKSLPLDKRRKHSSIDSSESGYSSQSPVPSPASSSHSDQDTICSFSTNRTSYSIDSSYSYASNPNGRVVQLRSQFDYYLGKALKPKTSGSQNTDLRTKIVEKKVIDWRSKTLEPSCPTPKHETFAETPPCSPPTTTEDYLDLEYFHNYEYDPNVDDNAAAAATLDLELNHLIETYTDCDKSNEIIDFLLS